MEKDRNSRTEFMECKHLFSLLSRYVDADLAPDTCAQIKQHLEHCEPCVAFLNTLRRTAELCQQYQPAEMPRPLKDQVRKELRAVYEAALARNK